MSKTQHTLSCITHVLIAIAISACLFPISLAQAETIDPLPRYTVSVAEIELQLANSLTEQGAGELVEATMTGQDKATVYGNDSPLTVDIKSLSFDATQKRWSANLLFVSGETVLSAMPATGRYRTMIKLPVVNNPVASGDIITEEMISWKAFPDQYSRSNTITEAEKLIGQTPRHTITPQRPIRENEVMAQAIIKKNAMVQMEYQSENIHISTAGQALMDGAKGDIIKIKNLNSEQIVRAVVKDENTVSVKPMVQTSSLEGGSYAAN